MELLTIREMRQSDAKTIEFAVDGLFLMEQAGAAVAAAVEAFGVGPCHVIVFAGPGNNGGDAFIAARDLLYRGYKISIFTTCPLFKLRGDAREAANLYLNAVKQCQMGRAGAVDNHEAVIIEKIDLTLIRNKLQQSDLIIDGLFGAGLDRDIEAELRELVTEINDAGIPVIAIDVPSGVNGDSGKIYGCAIKATKTVTFFRPKPGHYLLPGRELSGELIIKNIGISDRVLNEINPQYSLNMPSLWKKALPKRAVGTHKYHQGALLVVGGDKTMRGAAVLSSNAAIRASIGLVTLTRNTKDLQPHPNSFSAIMQCHITPDEEQGAHLWNELINKRKITAALIGPGAKPDEATRVKTLNLLKAPCHCVIDAGALAAFSDNPQNLFNTIGDRSNKEGSASDARHTILTPHTGEFKYLFGAIGEKQSKIDAALKAARKSGAVIILKGADTIIASPDGRAAVNNNAPATLATAGTGDVLAGITAALLAKNIPPFEAACAAVYFHGECANAIGTSLVADDLIDLLPQVMRSYQN